MYKKNVKHPIFKYKRTLGQKLADGLTRIAGSWGFIIAFFVFLIAWIIANVVWIAHRTWDPYPFILLNLVLSCLAAIQAPVILMSQNRQSQRDRLTAKYDYATNRRAEKKIQDILKEIKSIKRKLQEK